MPQASRGAAGQVLFVRCPDCGSRDTRQHYDEDDAACNLCGSVFSISSADPDDYDYQRDLEDEEEYES